MNKRDHEREALRSTMQGKDLWMIRALVLAKRLKNAGLDGEDVVECKDKKQLYDELIEEAGC